MKKLLLIDGHAMAYRAHFALSGQGLTNTLGQPTETIFGFYRMLAKLLLERKPDFLALIFDPPGYTFRSELYHDYKANRPPMPNDLKLQLDELQQIAQTANIPMIIPENAEADDAIATICEITRKIDNIHTEIVSGDKDLYHCLRKNTHLLRPKKGVSEFIEIDEAWVEKELGITREQVPDYMALVGDASDNVPGVKGIGEKTAAKLLQTYKTLDSVYDKIETIKPDGIRQKLITGKENAFLSRKLVTLKSNLPIDFQLNSMIWHADNNTLEIFRSRGLNTLVTDFRKLMHETPAKQEALQTDTNQKFSILSNSQTIQDLDTLQHLITEISLCEEIAIDTETDSLSIVSAKLIGVSLAWKKNEQLYSAYVPCVFATIENPHLDYNNHLPADKVLAEIKTICENGKVRKILQNAKYDLNVFRTHRVTLNGEIHDTMIFSYLLNPNQRRHNMDDLAESWLGYATISFDSLTKEGKKRKHLLEIPLEELAKYAAEDAEVTYLLRNAMLPRIQEEGYLSLYQSIDLPLMHVLAGMEYEGIKIDSVFLEELKSRYEKNLQKIEKDIYKFAGEEFNINSTHELQRILFQKLGIASGKKTDKGALSTDASVLESLKKEHKIIEKLLEYRMYNKLLTTYVEPLPLYVNAKTNRIHTSFSQVTAATGRLASLEPNLQNIPIRGTEGHNLRKVFVAEDGHKLLSFDYSQIELRILAHYCEDENLLRAYKENADIHDQAVYLLFRNSFDPVVNKWLPASERSLNAEIIDTGILAQMKKTPEFADKRSQAKVLNFSIVYGVTEFGLSQNLGISRQEARQLMELYFSAFPGIKTYMHNAIESARTTGYTVNYFGRKRKVADIHSKNRFAREGAERLAINTPIQSTAADIIKLAMIKIQNYLDKNKLKTRMLLQIHDELLFEVPPQEEIEIFDMAKDLMENAASLKVPLKVSGNFGKSWDEAK